MFLQNLECELGLALTTLGTIVIYGVKLIPRGRDSLGITARRMGWPTRGNIVPREE
jgi:hypothetical protein